MLALLFGHVCAIAVGVSLGLIGGGGSILAVPILVYVMGLGAKSAIAISLISVGVVSLIGTFLHWRAGNVRADIALLFAPTAMVGAYLGALLAGLPWVSEGFQLFCFSVIMLLASFVMIRKSRHQAQVVRPVVSGEVAYDGVVSSTESDRSLLHKSIIHKSIIHSAIIHKVIIHSAIIPAEGLCIGMLTGFVGIGGGFAIVPALVLLTHIPMKQAVGTSLLIIALKSITGFLGYVGQTSFSWSLVVSFTLAACLGTLLGSYLNKFMNACVLQSGFGYFIFSFAVLMLLTQFSF